MKPLIIYAAQHTSILIQVGEREEVWRGGKKIERERRKSETGLVWKNKFHNEMMKKKIKGSDKRRKACVAMASL